MLLNAWKWFTFASPPPSLPHNILLRFTLCTPKAPIHSSFSRGCEHIVRIGSGSFVVPSVLCFRDKIIPPLANSLKLNLYSEKYLTK